MADAEYRGVSPGWSPHPDERLRTLDYLSGTFLAGGDRDGPRTQLAFRSAEDFRRYANALLDAAAGVPFARIADGSVRRAIEAAGLVAAPAEVDGAGREG